MNARHIDDRSDEGYTPTTTHAEFGAGNPRLRVSRDDLRSEFLLEVDVVRIGSAADNELRLDGSDPVHATITHDDRDEYVVELHGEGEMNTNPDADATHPGERKQTLRTGARFTVGPWELVFARDEFADHGRPYGGRKGGEYSDQPLQPPRPGYDDAASVESDAPTHADSADSAESTAAEK
ncbi:FHA domain-containing protein [Microbacterium sp. WCS2018Hpa-23]|uniref:FHA domain-containing protein n=1 Tax=Microbacterium sp. WCS2018Hpa-23 TaxID=3073634 RepID=UPI002882FC4C|nr:FHA domain-containing protein [Microbacterium sp. WCS2018Hpa-23]